MERLTKPNGKYLNLWNAKLKRYEDTGMEPEDVLTGRVLAETACAINVLKKYQDIGTVEEFAALKEASDKVLSEYAKELAEKRVAQMLQAAKFMRSEDDQ